MADLYTPLGIFGDVVDFSSLPGDLQHPALAERLGAVKNTGPSTATFMACGSPGEVANRPELGNMYFSYIGDYGGYTSSDQIKDQDQYNYIAYSNGKTSVWANVVFKGEDQLRQRMAWTLANIFPIGDDAVGFSNVST